jgi:hypothetical protein
MERTNPSVFKAKLYFGDSFSPTKETETTRSTTTVSNLASRLSKSMTGVTLTKGNTLSTSYDDDTNIMSAFKDARDDRIPQSSPVSKEKDNETKVLQSMVQSLAQKLKKRDLQVKKLQEKDDLATVTEAKLATAEERIIDLVAENHSLQRQIQRLEAEAAARQSVSVVSLQGNKQAAIDPSLKIKSGEKTSETKNRGTVEDEADPLAEESESESSRMFMLKQERDAAIKKAGSMAMQLADLRAENDDLRDELTSVLAGGHSPKGSQSSRSKVDDHHILSAPPLCAASSGTTTTTSGSANSSGSPISNTGRSLSIRNYLWQ